MGRGDVSERGLKVVLCVVVILCFHSARGSADEYQDAEAGSKGLKAMYADEYMKKMQQHQSGPAASDAGGPASSLKAEYAAEYMSNMNKSGQEAEPPAESANETHHKRQHKSGPVAQPAAEKCPPGSYYEGGLGEMSCGKSTSRQRVELAPAAARAAAAYAEEAPIAADRFVWSAPTGTEGLHVSLVLRPLADSDETTQGAVGGFGGLGKRYAALSARCGASDGESSNETLIAENHGLLNDTVHTADIQGAHWSWSGDCRAEEDGKGVCIDSFRVDGVLHCDIEVTIANLDSVPLMGEFRYSWVKVEPCADWAKGIEYGNEASFLDDHARGGAAMDQSECSPCPEDIIDSGCSLNEEAVCLGGPTWQCVDAIGPSGRIRAPPISGVWSSFPLPSKSPHAPPWPTSLPKPVVEPEPEMTSTASATMAPSSSWPVPSATTSTTLVAEAAAPSAAALHSPAVLDPLTPRVAPGLTPTVDVKFPHVWADIGGGAAVERVDSPSWHSTAAALVCVAASVGALLAVLCACAQRLAGKTRPSAAGPGQSSAQFDRLPTSEAAAASNMPHGPLDGLGV